LDYLIVDTPPGTSDEHISTVQYLQKAEAVSGAILVTTPEEVSLADVRKELNFCQKTKVPILGVIENMGQYTTSLKKLKFKRSVGQQPTNDDYDDCTAEIFEKLQKHCPEILDTLVEATIYPQSGGGPKGMCEQYNVPYWGVLPMDPELLQSCETGKAFVDVSPHSLAAKALQGFCTTITTQFPVEEVP
jgi:Mrp family chromosome partitioning ATPase